MSERDRRHFDAIAEAERQSEDERIERALRTPPGQRIVEGLRLGQAVPLTPALLAEIDAQADGQADLARRRLELGLGWPGKVAEAETGTETASGSETASEVRVRVRSPGR